jgi:hypothetical protein
VREIDGQAQQQTPMHHALCHAVQIPNGLALDMHSTDTSKASAGLHKPVHRQQPTEKPMLSFASVDRRTSRARQAACSLVA